MERYIAPHMTLVDVEGMQIIAASGDRNLGLSSDDADQTKEVLVKDRNKENIWGDQW